MGLISGGSEGRAVLRFIEKAKGSLYERHQHAGWKNNRNRRSNSMHGSERGGDGEGDGWRLA